MAGIICKQCGYENPEGSTICEICAEELGGTAVQTPASAVTNTTVASGIPVGVQSTHNVSTAPVQPSVPVAGDGREYFVLCPESQTKTVLSHPKVKTFFCEGCKKEHEIDDFLWVVEVREKTVAEGNVSTCTQEIPSAPKGDNLWLEEINTHFRIDIAKTGGTLGRYGTFGAAFFQSRNLLTVSGEHCMISYEFGNWVLRHRSRTNQTVYNNMVLGLDEPNLLEDGKLLVLANTVTFMVRIG